MGDSDIGEMFLNFMLEKNCACLAGVDLTHYVSKGELVGEVQRHLVRWNRCLILDGRNVLPLSNGARYGSCQRNDHGGSK
jgi:hypothetical protein